MFIESLSPGEKITLPAGLFLVAKEFGGGGAVYLSSITLTFFRLSRIMCMRCNCSKLTYDDILILGINQS